MSTDHGPGLQGPDPCRAGTGTSLVPAHPTPELPALPEVGPADLYGALLADARVLTTRKAREQDARDFGRFLALTPGRACALLVSGGAAKANAIAMAYTRHLLDRRLSPATVNRRVSTLRRLVKLGRKLGVIDWGIEVDGQKAESYRDTRGPGRAGWLRVLDAATRTARFSAKGRRDLVILRLLHDHGLRRGEVAGLELADYDAEGGRLFVIGKGRQSKSPITLNRPTVVALERWLTDRGRDPGPLFTRLDRARPKDRVEGIDGKALWEVTRSLGSLAKLPGKVRPHGLRHQGITRVLEMTSGNIDAAQKFARHADPKTTQRYNDNRSDVAGEMARMLGDDS